MVTAGVGPSSHPYHRFGNGEQPLLILPGVTDGSGWWTDPSWLTATALAQYYFRGYQKYDVWVVARPPGSASADSREMAAGYADMLETLGPAHILGISLGGVIGAHLATETDLVDRLVLVSCGVGLGSFGRQTVARWAEYAATGRYRELHLDYIQQVYAGRRRLVMPLCYRLGAHWLPEPAVPGDVVRSGEAMLAYDGRILPEVSVPTLVVGGRDDPLVPVASHREAARRLDCTLAVASGGHAVYEESRRGVTSVVTSFLDGG